MFWLYLVLGIIGGLILLVVIIGFASPRYTYMKRSIEINSSAQKAFDSVNNLKSFVDHVSPWTGMDPNAIMKFTGPEAGVGSHYAWEGDRKKVGKGTMEITSVENNKKVVSRLIFQGRGEADVAFIIEEKDANTVNVTWDFSADNKNNPIGRIFGRMMDKFLGPDYEKGLKRMKEYLEKA